MWQWERRDVSAVLSEWERRQSLYSEGESGYDCSFISCKQSSVRLSQTFILYRYCDPVIYEYWLMTIFMCHIEQCAAHKIPWYCTCNAFTISSRVSFFVHAESGPVRAAHEFGTPGPFLSRRQVLQTSRDHQETLWAAVDTTTTTCAVNGTEHQWTFCIH